MALVEEAASKIDLGDYIFEAVTREYTFAYFEARGIPCSRNVFYERLRAFYYVLDKLRQ